jgi:hypothetical protein
MSMPTILPLVGLASGGTGRIRSGLLQVFGAPNLSENDGVVWTFPKIAARDAGGAIPMCMFFQQLGGWL